MREIAVIGDEGFTLGFRLVGVREVYTPSDGEEFEETVEMLSRDEDVGIVVVHGDDVKGLSKNARRTVRDSIDPIFVQLSEERGEEDLREKIKRAIGVDLWQ
ncbi:MAG: V-type ATP synthase subunit F [Methanonatronarchaeales archaeon]|nr:V-type ATP synthase subunit F [Methanonatronarchaeales archaeon]